MDYFEIEGKNQLFGNITVSGAKNAVLPLMAASILNDKPLTISNVPKLSDSITMGNLIKEMGGEVSFEESNIFHKTNIIGNIFKIIQKLYVHI